MQNLFQCPIHAVSRATDQSEKETDLLRKSAMPSDASVDPEKTVPVVTDAGVTDVKL